MIVEFFLLPFTHPPQCQPQPPHCGQHYDQFHHLHVNHHPCHTPIPLPQWCSHPQVSHSLYMLWCLLPPQNMFTQPQLNNMKYIIILKLNRIHFLFVPKLTYWLLANPNNHFLGHIVGHHCLHPKKLEVHYMERAIAIELSWSLLLYPNLFFSN